MYANRAYGVIHFELLIDKLDAEHYDKPGDKANAGCAERIYHVAAGGDGNKAGQRAVEGHGYIRLFIANPGDAHDGDGGYGSGQVCGNKDAAHGDQSIVAGGGNCGAAVKAKPAEPEDKHAKRAQG